MSDVDVIAVPVEPTPGEGGGDGKKRPLAPFVALAVAAVLAALFWVLAGAKSGENETADTPLSGKPAPAVRSAQFDGGTFDLSRRKGSWVVLNFFNSTCVPCIQEHPDLVSFVEQQRALPSDGAELYTIVNDDTDHAVEDFFAENGGDWPIVRDDDGAIAVAFGVSKVPETWIINPDGYVVARYISRITADELGITLQQFREAYAR